MSLRMWPIFPLLCTSFRNDVIAVPFVIIDKSSMPIVSTLKLSETRFILHVFHDSSSAYDRSLCAQPIDRTHKLDWPLRA